MIAGADTIPAPEGEQGDAQDALARGAWLFQQTCEFARGVATLEGLPEADRTEIALCGRSNVGKSSLMNSLTGRRTLARVSHTPGRTRELNFFRLPADKAGLYLVDLPGYGFASAPKKRIGAWQKLLFSYLRGRPTLRRVFLLIDARHGIKNTDQPAMTDLDEAAVSYQIVLTKADKLKPAEREARLAEVRRDLKPHVAAHPTILLTSSVTGEGIDTLRAEIAALVPVDALGYKAASEKGGRA